MALQKLLKSVTGHENPEAYHTLVLTWPQPPATPVLRVTSKDQKDQISEDQKEVGRILEVYGSFFNMPEYEDAVDV